jgi:hypothetical protein
MNKGKYVYTQIVEFLPQWMFDNIGNKYEGNKYVKHFTCWNHLLVMVFGQITNRDSLQDLIVAIVGYNLQINCSTYEILQISGISLLDKTPINETFTNTETMTSKSKIIINWQSAYFKWTVVILNTNNYLPHFIVNRSDCMTIRYGEYSDNRHLHFINALLDENKALKEELALLRKDNAEPRKKLSRVS